MADIDTLKNEKEKLIQDLEAKNKQKKDLEKNIVQSEQKKNEEVAAQKQKYETKVKTLKETIGKNHALKRYYQFAALNTSCFWGSTGSNITPVGQFHEIFVTKIKE